MADASEGAKESFWSDILNTGKQVLGGAGARLGETVSGRPREGGYSSTTEQVGAGLFDVLYERLKSGSKAATNKAAEKFRETKFGKNFIDESTRLQVESFFQNPIYAIGALVLVLFLFSAVAKR
jgi:hypothetical protein